MISLRKNKDLTPLQKLPKNVGNLGKIIGPRALKSYPKCNISPNLVKLFNFFRKLDHVVRRYERCQGDE